MGRKQDIGNTVFHVARDVVLAHASTSPELRADDHSYGLGTCTIERAGASWRKVPPGKRLAVFKAVADALGVDHAARVAQHASRLMEIDPASLDVPRICHDFDIGVLDALMPVPDWSALSQVQFDARYFWLDAAYMAAKQITAEPRVIWLFKRSMMAVLEGIVPNPFDAYLG